MAYPDTSIELFARYLDFRNKAELEIKYNKIYSLNLIIEIEDLKKLAALIGDYLEEIGE
jgi:hypothetical protein